MLFKSFQQWWGESARDRRSRARRKPARQRHISRLDVLEDRTLLSTLLVKSAADDGSAGTLRLCWPRPTTATPSSSPARSMARPSP